MRFLRDALMRFGVRRSRGVIDPMIAAMSTVILAATVVIAFIAERTVGFAQIFGGINK